MWILKELIGEDSLNSCVKYYKIWITMISKALI